MLGHVSVGVWGCFFAAFYMYDGRIFRPNFGLRDDADDVEARYWQHRPTDAAFLFDFYCAQFCARAALVRLSLLVGANRRKPLISLAYRNQYKQR